MSEKIYCKHQTSEHTRLVLGSVIINKMKKDVVVEKYLKINDEMRGSLSAMTLPDFIIEAAREERNK